MLSSYLSQSSMQGPKKFEDFFPDNFSPATSTRKRPNPFPEFPSEEHISKRNKNNVIPLVYLNSSCQTSNTNCFIEPSRIFAKNNKESLAKISNQFKNLIKKNLLLGTLPEKLVFQPTPQKRRTQIGEYEKLFKAAENGSFFKEGIKYAVVCFGKGTLKNVYKIQHEFPQMQKEVNNCNSLIKLYSSNVKGFSESDSTLHMINSLENYKLVKELIPVSKIHNIETAINDRFLFVEFIPYEIDLGNVNHLKQVQQIIKKSFENKIPMDLSYSNLRVRDDKDETVTYIDLVEIRFDFSDEKLLWDFTVSYLKSWVQKSRDIALWANLPVEKQKKLAESLLLSITNGLEIYGFKPEWIEAALEVYFF